MITNERSSVTGGATWPRALRGAGLALLGAGFLAVTTHCGGSKGADAAPGAPLGSVKLAVGGSGYAQIAAGDGHNCALRASDQQVDCWGSNDFGESLPPIAPFISVATGYQRSCGVKADGTVACWGKGTEGTVPPGNDFVSVGVGGYHFCALKKDGAVTCWRPVLGPKEDADWGELNVPAGKVFTQISVAGGSTCGLVNDGSLACWGFQYLPPGPGFYVPGAVPSGTGFKLVTQGKSGACAQKADDTWVCWGAQYTEPIGGPPPPPSPALTPPNVPMASVAIGKNAACGVQADKTIRCWGTDRAGETYPPPGQFKTISSTFDEACAIRTDDAVQCWGNGRSGQTVAPNAIKVSSISTSQHHACAVQDDGAIYCWGRAQDAFSPISDPYTGCPLKSSVGYNAQGQPVCLPYFNGDRVQAPQEQSFRQVVSGLAHSCALRHDGSVACWGDSHDGRLNPPGAGYSSISSRGYHTCGVRSTGPGAGQVDCWGTNTASFPPSGPTRPIYPFESPSGNAWVAQYNAGQATVPSGAYSAVTTGLYNTCARKQGDGTWTCWGEGVPGPTASACQPIYGLPPPYPSPYSECCNVGRSGQPECNWYGQSAVPAVPFSAISTRQLFSAGLKGDGTLAYWGQNDQAQWSSPPGRKFVDVSVGREHTCGLESDGNVRCWGASDKNQANVPAGVKFTKIAAGEDSTCGITTAGAPTCWGFNDARQTSAPVGIFKSIAVRKTRFTEEVDHEMCVLKHNSWAYCSFGMKPYPSALPFKDFGLGEHHQCGLQIDGRITCTVDGVDGNPYQLDVVPNALNLTVGPGAGNTVPLQGNFVAMSVGARHVCGLTRDFGASIPTLYCWGEFGSGARQILVGTDGVQNFRFNSLTSGGSHFCGVTGTPAGAVLCLVAPGGDTNGQAVPPSGSDFTMVRGGYYNTCALRQSGQAVCWGDDSAGVNEVPPGTYKDLAVGYSHACAIKMDDGVVCWGSPIESPAGRFRSLAASKGFTCGERLDRTVACWGNVILGTRTGLKIKESSATLRACEEASIQLTTDSGTEPFTFSLVSGTLPSGLTLTPSGQLVGRPVDVARAYSFTVGVLDKYGYRGIGDFSLSLTTGVPAIIGVVDPDPLTHGVRPQQAETGTAFARRLEIQISDCARPLGDPYAPGNPIANVPVSFLATTGTGATANLSAQTVNTNGGGVAGVSATANGSAGSYVVQIRAAGTNLGLDWPMSNVKGLKTACVHDAECLSGFCADGVCCNSACGGTCQSCDGAFNTGGTGTCSPVQAGIDPRNQCGKPTCAQDSVVKSACNGAGSCQATSEACSPYGCDPQTKACRFKCQNDNDCAAGGTCDQTRGQCIGGVIVGTCQDSSTVLTAAGQTRSCAPYLCVHGGCRSECVTSDDCVSGNVCKGQVCEAVVTDDAGPDTPVTINAKRGCSVGASGASSTGAGAGALLGLAAALGLAARRARRRGGKCSRSASGDHHP